MQIYFIIFILIIGLDRVAPESKDNSVLFPVFNLRNQNERNIVMPAKIPIEELINKRFRMLTIVGEGKLHRQPNGRSTRYILCVCDCGNKTEIRLDQILSKDLRRYSISCGCYHKKILPQIAIKHNLYKTRIYRTWRGMKGRCLNPNNKKYHIYGGRGIKVCEEWLSDFMNFYDWAMLNGYVEDLTIDRINSNGNYEANNCQWITSSENSRKTNRWLK